MVGTKVQSAGVQKVGTKYKVPIGVQRTYWSTKLGTKYKILKYKGRNKV